jgi:hypothetical protein
MFQPAKYIKNQNLVPRKWWLGLGQAIFNDSEAFEVHRGEPRSTRDPQHEHGLFLYMAKPG